MLTNKSNKKINILQLEPVSSSGGVTQFIDRIVRYLPPEVFQVHFAASGIGEAFYLLKEHGVITHTILGDYSLCNFFRAVCDLKNLIEKEDINIVHAHTAKAGLLAVLAAKKTSAKVIFTGHGWRFLQLRNPLKRLILFLFERYIIKNVSAITYLTEKEETIGVALAPTQVHRYVIPFSLDVQKYNKETENNFRKNYSISEDALLVIMVGRITYQKDPKTFAQAASLILKINPNARFFWIGEGDRRLLPSFITITGHLSQEKVIEALQGSDILLFTSRFEGLPIVLLEAMAVGIPIVAAKVSGVPEVIFDKVTGELFSKGNAREAVQKIMGLYNNKVKINHYKENAMKRIEKDFSPVEKTAYSFALLYKKIYELPYH